MRSPARIPSPSSARCRAALPVWTAVARPPPTSRWTSPSKRRTSSPPPTMPLRSGMVGGGEEVLLFEGEVQRLVGGGRATAVHTGSAALHLALLGLGIRAGDRILLPTYVCAAVLNAVKY